MPRKRLALLVLLVVAVVACRKVMPEIIPHNSLSIAVPPDGRKIAIAPLAIYHDECEGKLTVGTPGWRGDFLLPKTAWTYRALRPGSLVVTRADSARTKLIEGKDYVVDWNWGSINAVKTSHIPARTKLRFAYDYTLSRLDLIEQTPGGDLVVKRGKEDMSEPRLPAPTKPNAPLFSVYLPHNTTTLSSANLNRIDPAIDGTPPVSGTDALLPLLRKLDGKDPFTIVFFGDSITAQPPSLEDGRGSFVDRVTAYLRERYPHREVVLTRRDAPITPGPRQLVVVKAGVGGDSTREGLKRIDSDVLSHHPDLVVIMFGVNDENSTGATNNVPVADYRRNLDSMVTAIRKGGGEPVLMTTSMKNKGWIGTRGNLGEYAAAVRALGSSRGICVVDNFRAWQSLPARGYNYMILLDSSINHPNDLGHDLFYQGLKKALTRSTTYAKY